MLNVIGNYIPYWKMSKITVHNEIAYTLIVVYFC